MDLRHEIENLLQEHIMDALKPLGADIVYIDDDGDIAVIAPRGDINFICIANLAGEMLEFCRKALGADA